MTPDELQVEFPLGSRWQVVGRVGIHVVCGWHPLGYVITASKGCGGAETWDLDSASHWTRVPDPVPCPITEPTTIRASIVGRSDSGLIEDRTHWGTGCTGIAVTLHPAEPGATEGRYTWGDV